MFKRVRAFFHYRRVGGLHFLRVGRFGASFYVKARDQPGLL